VELLARTGDQSAVGMPISREIPELSGKDGTVVDHAVAAGDRVARQLIGEISRAVELERIEQQFAHCVFIRLVGGDLNDAASGVERRIVVRELPPRCRQLRQLAHAGDVTGQSVVTTAKVPFVVPHPAGAMVEALAQCHLGRGHLVRHAEIGQVAAHRGAQVELALLDQPHDSCAGKGLGGRGDAKEGVAVDRLGLLDVGDTVTTHVLFALVEHADGDAGDVVPVHTGFDLGVQLAEQVFGRLRVSGCDGCGGPAARRRERRGGDSKGCSYPRLQCRAPSES
jgi:hypothetical protein